MSVEFYRLKNEIIPTNLRLLVNGKQVVYWPVDGMFAYDFQFTATNEQESLEIAKELAQIMSLQSYNYGEYWEVTDISNVNATGTIIRVRFRFGNVNDERVKL